MGPETREPRVIGGWLSDDRWPMLQSAELCVRETSLARHVPAAATAGPGSWLAAAASCKSSGGRPVRAAVPGAYLAHSHVTS